MSGSAHGYSACTVATSEDRDAIVALWERCGLTRPWNDPRADFDMAVTGAASAVLILRDGDALVGSAMVGHDGHRGGVYYLAIDPVHQRRGHGRRLMTAVEAWLRARGVPKLNLLVRHENAAVIGFYEALGYADTDCRSLGKRLD